MIRTLTHRAVDLVFDVVAELFATLLDLGVLTLDLLRRARERWSARREVPSWDALGHDAGPVDPVAVAGEGVALAGVSLDAPSSGSFFDDVLREGRARESSPA